MRAAAPLLVAATAALSSVAPAGASRNIPYDPIPTDPVAVDLPITRQHTYRMAGKVRMLLLWVGREDVGNAVINWRGQGEHRAYELLIGSDPAKAPGKLNKWGYLVEETRGENALVVGLISQNHEDRLDDVKQGAIAGEGGRPFDTVRGRVGLMEAHARVGTLLAPASLTYKDVPAVLKLMFEDTSKPLRRLDRPSGVRCGFLTSLTELVNRTLAVPQVGRPSEMASIPYVHGDRVYKLRLLESTGLARFEQDGHQFEKVIRSRFETARINSRTGTRFELVYGTTGHLRGIPILVSYQPTWWLQVDLVLQK
jgi:hypothetical protein